MPKNDSGVAVTWKLLGLLASGPKRIGELAEGLGVTERAAQRLLANVRETNIPLEETPDKDNGRIIRYRVHIVPLLDALRAQ